MRRYPVNSNEAMSRLIALALLADGGLDRSELAALADCRVLQRLGISESLFHRVTQELCDDLLLYAVGQEYGHLELGPEWIDPLLAEVDDPALQVSVLRAMLSVVDADGWLADGEAVLIARAMALWHYDLFAMRARAPGHHAVHHPF